MAGKSVRAILSAVDKGFTTTMNAALDTVNTLGDRIKSGFAFGVITRAGEKAFDALTNGARDLIGELNTSNASWKTFESNLSMLGQSAGEITTVKKELQDFAQATIYGASDMATTYAQLAAVGVKNTTKLVKGFGGLAAAAENPAQAMKTLSTQATQMAAKPKVAWEDFKLMLEQTPAGIAAVARAMGMSTSELVSAVQDGDVATQEFLNTIAEVGTNKDFTELATKAKTVGQAMDGAKETITNKLTPAFDVLSQAGINAIESITSKMDGIDAQGLADKVSGAVDTILVVWDVLKSSFSGTGAAISGAFSAVAGSLGEVAGSILGVSDQASALETFQAVCEKVAAGIKTVAGWVQEHSDTIAKFVPVALGLAAAFKIMQVVNAVAPGVAAFGKSIAQMAGKGLAGLAAKLFGTAAGETAVGTASASSTPSILQSAVALLALGGAVLLAAAGLGLIVQSAIALADAGWPAVAALAGLVVVVVGLAVGAAVLGPVLTAGAVGLIAFGAAILMVGVGAVLAAASLAIIAGILPTLVTYGTSGAVAILALGGSMLVFGAGAAVAGAGALVLGAGLLVVGAAVLVAAVGVLALAAGCVVLGVGLAIAAASLTVAAVALPLVAAGAQGAASGFALLLASSAGLSAIMVALAAASVAGAAGIIAFGAGVTVAAVGAAAMALALTTVAKKMSSIASDASTAEKALDNMQDAVSVVEAGLDALGDMAKTAMDALCSAFDGAAGDSLASAQKLARGYVSALQTGLAAAPTVAAAASNRVTATLRSGYSGAYSAGAYISAGFAAGMLSYLSVIRSAAAQMASAADAAVRAKAQIHSPSRVAMAEGAYWGAGLAEGIRSAKRSVWAAAEELIAIPTVQTPRVAMAYGGELSTDYSYYQEATYTVDVPLTIDGREVARATATYTQDELERQQTRADRKRGRTS